MSANNLQTLLQPIEGDFDAGREFGLPFGMPCRQRSLRIGIDQKDRAIADPFGLNSQMLASIVFATAALSEN